METFVSYDGKVFDSKESCEKYESELKEKALKEKEILPIMQKLNAVDVANNDCLYNRFCEGFDHFFKAYKFIYHSDCSLMDVLQLAECTFSFRKEPIYTIVDGIEREFYIEEFPQLEIGETYLIVNYEDTSGDYHNAPTYYLVKLSDYKEYLINEINEI